MEDSTQENAAPTLDRLALGWAPLLLARVWKDVNERIWERCKSDWAKVLRTFRSKRANYYSRRFGWFHQALFAVMRASASARGVDREILRGLKTLDRDALQDLASAMQIGLASVHVVPTTDDERLEHDALNRELATYADDLRSLVARTPALLERVRQAIPEPVRAGLFDGDILDAEHALFAYELRMRGFEPREIAPLDGTLPQDTASQDEPLRRRDLVWKVRNAVRSDTRRTAQRIHGKKASPDWGAREKSDDPTAVVSLRVGSDADDDDADRTHAAGGSESPVSLADGNAAALDTDRPPTELPHRSKAVRGARRRRAHDRGGD